MKVKDLIEILQTLDPEAIIGPPVVEDRKPDRIIKFYNDKGWIEEKSEENSEEKP